MRGSEEKEYKNASRRNSKLIRRDLYLFQQRATLLNRQNIAFKSNKETTAIDCNYKGTRGVFMKGAIGPWPPLWVARIAKLHRKMSKIEACPPPLQVEHQALGSKSPDFGRKLGRNLSEDLFFFFSLHLTLGEKLDKI